MARVGGHGIRSLTMAAKERLLSILQSGAAMTAASSILVTGAYVVYKDHQRFPRMHHAYSHGNLLPPLAENQHEVTYFRRPELETKIRHLLKPVYSNEYYLINGEVGSGKTRSIVEIVRELMDTDGAAGKGAPVFVAVSQGKSFPDTLAAAVNFLFDEHISFKFFLDFVLRINSFPGREDHHKMTRLLDAIEGSAFEYLQRTGRPVVLVIDGANCLAQSMPGALERLQEKAKLWADTNIVKVIFISNDEKTELLLQENSSNWSRAATPLAVGDLSRDEAIAFLTESSSFMESSIEGRAPIGVAGDDGKGPMDMEAATNIYNLVGGRMHNLISFKRDWILNIPFEETATELKSKEREKFINVSRCPSQWKVVEAIRKAPEKTVWMSKLIENTSQKDVYAMFKSNVIRVERRGTGIVCKFQSKLTEIVVDEFYH